jgi:hypothetical protein
MAYSYTNRKGSTYYLCQLETKTGKMRYYFAREPKATPVDKIPAGYQVDESVNGVVSLVKVRPQLILPEELACVETNLKKHLEGHKYRAVIRNNQIVICESQGSDYAEILIQLGWNASESPDHKFREHNAQYSPIMRFILNSSEGRIFIPQRWCFRGSIDDWINAGDSGKIDFLAERLIPKLGTDEFFELY